MRHRQRQRDIDEPGLLARMLKDCLAERKWTINQFAQKLDVTYESARRITLGQSVPSDNVLRMVCQALQLDHEKMERLARAEIVRRKYGDVVLELAHKLPSLEPIELVWNDLTEHHQGDLISMARAWAARDKGAAVAQSTASRE